MKTLWWGKILHHQWVMWHTISSTWCKHIQTHRFFHIHHHEIPLHGTNHPHYLSLGDGSFNPPNCSLYWPKPIYHQQTMLQTLSEPTQALWWSSIHHYSYWHASCYLSYWKELEMLRMLSRSPSHFQTSRTTPLLPRQSVVTLGKLVWRLWWSKNAPFSLSVIGGSN